MSYVLCSGILKNPTEMKLVAHIINEETPCTQRMYKQKELFSGVFLNIVKIYSFHLMKQTVLLKNNIVYTFRSYI